MTDKKTGNEVANADVPAIPGQDNSVMTMLAKAVSDPDFNAEKLELLINLKERVDATEAKRAFIDAMFKFHEDPPRVIKNKAVFGKDESKGPQYHFAEFDETVKVVRPALRKVGIIATWESEDLGSNITKVTCVLRHKLGHEERASMAGAPEVGGSKNALQGIGSSSAYLRKYTYLLVTGLVAEGEDNDGGDPKGWKGPLKVTALKKASKDFHRELQTLNLMEHVDLLQRQNQGMLDQLEVDLPVWFTGDGGDIKGTQGALANKREEISARS